MEFPMFLHEIDVRFTNYFKFTMPACFAGGHEDIEMSVEYGDTVENPKTVTYNAWARSGDSSVKFFIYTNKVSANDNAADNIMKDLNENSNFHEQMNHFIGFIEDKETDTFDE